MYVIIAKIKDFIVIFAVIIILFSISSIAHEEEKERLLNDDIKDKSISYLIIASIISLLFTIYSVWAERRTRFEKKKMLLFLGIIIPIAITTLYIITATIYLNVTSQTKGPVHWHADFEIYICDEQMDIINPTRISNRIGNPLIHEHDDNGIHIEGVIVDKADVDLHNFFNVIGGELTEQSITIPTNRDIVKVTNGDMCNSDMGKLQAFVYKTENGIVKQEKLIDFENYVISPYSLIPPGDCIIIEFGKEKNNTKHICETYRVGLKKGDIRTG